MPKHTTKEKQSNNYRRLIRNLVKREENGVSPTQARFDKFFKKYISKSHA